MADLLRSSDSLDIDSKFIQNNKKSSLEGGKIEDMLCLGISELYFSSYPERRVFTIYISPE